MSEANPLAPQIRGWSFRLHQAIGDVGEISRGYMGPRDAAELLLSIAIVQCAPFLKAAGVTQDDAELIATRALSRAYAAAPFDEAPKQPRALRGDLGKERGKTI